MKKFGTIVAWILGAAVLAVVTWLGIAGAQGKTIKDTLPEDTKQEAELPEDTVGDENEVGDTTTASITYNAQTNVINVR